MSAGAECSFAQPAAAWSSKIARKCFAPKAPARPIILRQKLLWLDRKLCSISSRTFCPIRLVPLARRRTFYSRQKSRACVRNSSGAKPRFIDAASFPLRQSAIIREKTAIVLKPFTRMIIIVIVVSVIVVWREEKIISLNLLLAMQTVNDKYRIRCNKLNVYLIIIYINRSICDNSDIV